MKYKIRVKAQDSKTNEEIIEDTKQWYLANKKGKLGPYGGNNLEWYLEFRVVSSSLAENQTYVIILGGKQFGIRVAIDFETKTIWSSAPTRGGSQRRKFTKQELEYYYALGFKLDAEFAEIHNQQTEDWF